MPEVGAVAIAISITVSFVGSFVTAAFGIGGGILTLATLGSVLPANAVIPIHGAVQVGSNAGRLVLMFKYFCLRSLGPFAVGALIGAVIGGNVVVTLDPATLQITLGLFILWTVFFNPPALLARSGAAVGGVSSFLTMFVGGTGPFVITFIKSLGLDRLGLVATHAGLMTIQHSLKTLIFAILGFAFAAWWPLIGAMIIAGFIGTLLGKKLLLKSDEQSFRTILNMILVALALRLIVVGSAPTLTSALG